MFCITIELKSCCNTKIFYCTCKILFVMVLLRSCEVLDRIVSAFKIIYIDPMNTKFFHPHAKLNLMYKQNKFGKKMFSSKNQKLYKIKLRSLSYFHYLFFFFCFFVILSISYFSFLQLMSSLTYF